ncbi:protein kinase [Chitinimonas sp.]|uniref:serine/threonine-protein kinase n=1 Tax=Chitinimonas sp. TaxID=1934313 RepID=UPI0035B249FD
MQTLGHYRIDAQVGQGAMGIVYRAVDQRLDRTVALKVLRLSLTSSERAEYAGRLQQEARSAARLNHPGIITVYECGDIDGYAFLAMEFVEGKSLQALTDSGVRISVGRVQKLADQLFGALAYAHEHEVVHRDIKPANLMLTPDGRLKITDFGIALLPASDLTRTGTLVGSPRHMAPEQIEGKKVDGRADLFAAGIVLYELLTNTRPFDGEHLASIAYKILHEPVADLRQTHPDIPERLSGVVMRCLEKDPQQRFKTAREARAALRASDGSAKKADVKPAPAALLSPGVESKPAVARNGKQPVLAVPRWSLLVGLGVIGVALLWGAFAAYNANAAAAPVPAALTQVAPVQPEIRPQPVASAPAIEPRIETPAPAEPSKPVQQDDADKAGGLGESAKSAELNKPKPKPKASERGQPSPAAMVAAKPASDPAPARSGPQAVPETVHAEPQADKVDKRTFLQRLRGCDEQGNCPVSAPRPTRDK